MNYYTECIVLRTSVLLSTGLVFLAAITHAQDREIEEIVVTAAYREQSIQDVVGSAQVFGGAALDERGATGLEDYLLEVPSISLERSGNGTSKISIRGISNVNSSDLGYGGGSPTTGVYIDDVAIQGSGVFPDLNLFDLERIEVLKGPQGTLYGEGSMGGAIKMVTNAPDLEEWAVRTQASASTTSEGEPGFEIRGAVNVPIWRDLVAARIVANRRRSGSFIDYTTLGEDDANQVDAESLRAVVRFQPFESFQLDYMFLYDYEDRDQFPVVDIGREEDLVNTREENQFARTRFAINTVTARWELPFATLTSVSAFYDTYRNSRRRTPVLQNLIALQLLESGITAPDIFRIASTQVATKLDSFSQELRLVSAGDETIDWIAGVFYRDRSQSFEQEKREDSVPEDPTGLFTGLLAGFNPLQGRQEQGFGDEEFKQIAGYGEVTWEIFDRVDLTGGLRAFSEEISFFIDTQFYGVEAFLLATDPSTIDPVTMTARKFFSQSLQTDGLLPKVALSWQATDDYLLYATVSRGFRSGTPNIYSALESGPPVVEPDYVWNNEVGAKLTWLDGTLVTNVSAYHIDWQDLQGTILGTARLGQAEVQFAHLANAGDAVVMGAEGSVQWAPLDGLLLNLAGGYNHGEITSPKEGSQVRRGSKLPSTPELTGSTSGQYSHPLPFDLTGDVSAGYSYVAEQNMIFETSGIGGIPIDGYGLFRAAIGIGRENWRIQLFGENLADDRAVIAITQPIPQATVITPRVIGLRLSYDF